MVVSETNIHSIPFHSLCNFRLLIDALVAKIFSDEAVRYGVQMPNFYILIFSDRVLHISDLHSAFALRPHLWKYGRHPICDC